jgi:hypothetical protein
VRSPLLWQLLAGEDVDRQRHDQQRSGRHPLRPGSQVQSIFIGDVKTVVADGFVTRDDICKDIEDLCTANGI